MSDINLDFTVSNNSINFTVEPNDITFTPTDIQLTFNTSSQLNAGGSNTQLQYNNGSLLAGIPTATYNGSNLSLGNVANIKITGGVNGYVLQTDGTGNLDWAATGGGGGNGSPGGSNTQIQYNDSGTFGGNTGFTFNEISGNVAIPGSLSVVGNIFGNAQTAYLANFATVANSVAGANVSGFVANASYANLANYATTANSVAGANVSGIVANATFATTAGSATTAGTVTTNAQPNITSVGTLSNLSVTSNIISGNANLGNLAVANFFQGNGALLTGISVSSGTFISNGTSNVSVTSANGNVSTSINGVSDTLLVTATGANLKGNFSANGNINGIQLVSNVATGTAPLIVTSTTVVANLRAANANLANLANFATTANSVAGANVSGTVANATFATSAGSANTATTATRAGTVTTNAQPNITSVGTLTSLSVTGNITGSNVIGTHYGAATGLTNITGANVTGTVANATFATSAGSATTAGTVTTAAQPNITSVGNLSALRITSSTVALGNLAGLYSNGANSQSPIAGGASIAIGVSAGRAGQGLYSIAIAGAGNIDAAPQGNYAIAMGLFSGWRNQGISGIAIGQNAGLGEQGTQAVAIGLAAGETNQGVNSVAVGTRAGVTSQPNNSIVLNATGFNFNATQANSFFVNPIRNVTGNASFTVTLKYNPTTGEIGYV
jgi:hypothetical protein